MHFSSGAVIAVFAAGVLLGALCWRWRVSAANAMQPTRRIPTEWPLTLRPLVNSKERRVWLWLTKVMFDQQIMIKIPVTRFTSPAKIQDAEHWFKVLNGLYCTFTLCNASGKVIGCVDVPGRAGLSMGNQSLKHSLLSQCGLQYWIVDPENLPHLTQIRSAFLGEEAEHPGDPRLREKLKDVAVNLQAAVSKQRSQKTLGSGAAVLPSNWEENSFLAPLDSRVAALRQ